MPQVICLGELLIDFCSTLRDASLADAPAFAKAPGGAPANVAVGLRRLGTSSGFIGAVGDDPFGRFLGGVLADEGVDVSALAYVQGVRTTLAFVAVHSDGRKDVTFYRNPGADQFLAEGHIQPAYIRSAEALHYGSISLIEESPRAATNKARALAAQAGQLISYDPNLRPTLWPSEDLARQQIRQGFQGATVAKVSLEEWSFITGTDGLSAGAAMMFDAGVQLVIRSEGEQGASYVTPRFGGHVEPFPVEPVETTGTGDAFVACVITRLLACRRQGTAPKDLAEADLRDILRHANIVGALTTTKPGAIPAIPTADEVRKYL